MKPVALIAFLAALVIVIHGGGVLVLRQVSPIEPLERMILSD